MNVGKYYAGNYVYYSRVNTITHVNRNNVKHDYAWKELH